MDNMYYIQDTRSYVGNCIIWWRKDGAGYTTKIEEAGKFTEEKAKQICGSNEHKCQAWPCDYVDSKTSKIVDVQDVDYNKTLIVNENGIPTLGPIGEYGYGYNDNKFVDTANKLVREHNEKIGTFKTYGDQLRFKRGIMDRIKNVLRNETID